MACEWGQIDCKNEGLKCDLCFVKDFHYVPDIRKTPKPMARRQQKADKRMGGGFEYKNHVNNTNLLTDVSTRMTPNSGAGKVKGDEEISGIINIMEELKTKVKEQAPGKKSFTIKREWLEKLNREALEVNKEFWYLKFAFNEHDNDIYIVVEQDVIMSMVKTMVEDRKEKAMAQSIIDVAQRRADLKEAENIKLLAEIDLLKAQNKQMQLQMESNHHTFEFE